MYFSILLAPTDAELWELSTRAQALYMKAFPHTSRTHTVHRMDRGVARKLKESANLHSVGDVGDGKLKEREWLQRLTHAISSGTPSGCSVALGSAPLAVWTDKHEREQQFLNEKRRKRQLEVGGGVQM